MNYWLYKVMEPKEERYMINSNAEYLNNLFLPQT